MPETLPTDGARRSDAIAIARVICILGVVYVHAWTGRNGQDLEMLRGSAQEGLRWVLMEIFGRSAVPLLGLISGWLVGGSARTRNWTHHVGRKARTILLPMLLWNAVAILLVSGAAWFGGLSAPLPQSGGWVAQELFIVSRNPDINVQMPFLRDLFLCMLAAPLLVRMPNWALLLVAGAAAISQILGIGAPVLMRASILFFFTAGILARRGGWMDRAAELPLSLAVMPFVLLMSAQLYVSLNAGAGWPPLALSSLDMAVRIGAALGFWRLAWALAASPARGALLRVEPYAFFLFCAHLILIWLGGPVLGALFGPLGSPLYPFYLIVQPFLILAAVVVIGSLLRRIAPTAARVLSGGRLAPA
ncbi:acyltransferase [Sphingobium sp. AP49]|uniref:acyltransferase family protein n=1 Tax=Sphingobium sp. AP49 TaxID=1144307 RepID=UPI00026EE34E|nr:acyltransferase [Sphingobium sp. AP49]WHO40150.1 acyltransferase [Sphingobium sp. AP49]